MAKYDDNAKDYIKIVGFGARSKRTYKEVAGHYYSYLTWGYQQTSPGQGLLELLQWSTWRLINLERKRQHYAEPTPPPTAATTSAAPPQQASQHQQPTTAIGADYADSIAA